MTKLQEIREKKDMSKYRLAQLSGLSITYISTLESGKKSIEDVTVKNVKNLAQALNVDYTALID